MASNVSLCGVCETLGHSVPSTAWCDKCDEALCVNCKTQHTASKGTKSHQLISIEIYQQLPSDVLKISQNCPQHNERYQTYCGEHECACCLKCTLGKHKECKDMLPVDDIVGGVKVSNALTECMENMKENIENVDVIIKDRELNLSSLQQAREKMQTEIRETRMKVNEHLDKLETQILHQLNKFEELHTCKIQALVTSLEKKKQEMEAMQGSLSALKDHASDLQIFLSMKRTGKLTSSDDEYLQSLCSSKDLNHISLSVELEKTLRNLEICLPTFGRVSTCSKICGVVLNKRKDKQAQLHVSSVRSIDSIRLDRIRTIDVQKNFLHGCSFFSDGRFAVASHKDECIIVMTEDGTVDCQINVTPHFIIDITHIPSTNTLAATGWHNWINIINRDTKKIMRSFPSERSNFGITNKNGCLIYCAEDVGICKMSIESGEITTIKKLPNMSPFSYITTFQDKLYYTNYNAHTVTCCSIDGTTKWEFKNTNVLCNPQGIAIDTNGYVYVVGWGCNKLIVISPDGDRHSILLTREYELDDPSAVDYDRTTNRILVTNVKNKLLLYNVN